MKRVFSLLLVLSLVIALAPSAFADKANDGILKPDGHLVSCPGGACKCAEILYQAEKEAQELKAFEELTVWLINSRNEDGERCDTIVAELELPYFYADKMENQKYLDEHEAVKKLLLDYFKEDELAGKLYTSAGFIHTQVECSFDYLMDLSEEVTLEYRVMGAGSAEKVIVSCPAVEDEMVKLNVRVGDILVELPEACYNQAFILAMEIDKDGSAELLLVDEEGTAIEGAEIVK